MCMSRSSCSTRIIQLETCSSTRSIQYSNISMLPRNRSGIPLALSTFKFCKVEQKMLFACATAISMYFAIECLHPS